MLESNFVKSIVVKGIKVYIGIDNKNKSFFIEYNKDGKKHIDYLGQYNLDYISTIYFILDKNYRALVYAKNNGKLSRADKKELDEYLELFRRHYSE